MLSNLSKREKRILVVTALVLVGVGAYFLTNNLVERWNTLEEKITDAETRLEKSIQIYQEEANTRERYKEVVKSLRIEGTDSDKQSAITQELNKLMLEAEIQPRNYKPLQVIDEEKFQIFTFSYDDTETNMLNLVNFLELLETRSQVSEIQKIELKPPQPQSYMEEKLFKVNYRVSRLVYRRQ